MDKKLNEIQKNFIPMKLTTTYTIQYKLLQYNKTQTYLITGSLLSSEYILDTHPHMH